VASSAITPHPTSPAPVMASGIGLEMIGLTMIAIAPATALISAALVVSLVACSAARRQRPTCTAVREIHCGFVGARPGVHRLWSYLRNGWVPRARFVMRPAGAVNATADSISPQRPNSRSRARGSPCGRELTEGSVLTVRVVVLDVLLKHQG
jgi:hypothetical protein